MLCDIVPHLRECVYKFLTAFEVSQLPHVCVQLRIDVKDFLTCGQFGVILANDVVGCIMAATRAAHAQCGDSSPNREWLWEHFQIMMGRDYLNRNFDEWRTDDLAKLLSLIKQTLTATAKIPFVTTMFKDIPEEWTGSALASQWVSTHRGDDAHEESPAYQGDNLFVAECSPGCRVILQLFMTTVTAMCSLPGDAGLRYGP